MTPKRFSVKFVVVFSFLGFVIRALRAVKLIPEKKKKLYYRRIVTIICYCRLLYTTAAQSIEFLFELLTQFPYAHFFPEKKRVNAKKLSLVTMQQFKGLHAR